jgi:hypothetical protein
MFSKIVQSSCPDLETGYSGIKFDLEMSDEWHLVPIP